MPTRASSSELSSASIPEDVISSSASLSTSIFSPAIDQLPDPSPAQAGALSPPPRASILFASNPLLAKFVDVKLEAVSGHLVRRASSSISSTTSTAISTPAFTFPDYSSSTSLVPIVIHTAVAAQQQTILTAVEAQQPTIAISAQQPTSIYTSVMAQSPTTVQTSVAAQSPNVLVNPVSTREISNRVIISSTASKTTAKAFSFNPFGEITYGIFLPSSAVAANTPAIAAPTDTPTAPAVTPAALNTVMVADNSSQDYVAGVVTPYVAPDSSATSAPFATPTITLDASGSTTVLLAIQSGAVLAANLNSTSSVTSTTSSFSLGTIDSTYTHPPIARSTAATVIPLDFPSSTANTVESSIATATSTTRTQSSFVTFFQEIPKHPLSIALTALVCVAIVLLLAIVGFFCVRRRRRQKRKNTTQEVNDDHDGWDGDMIESGPGIGQAFGGRRESSLHDDEKRPESFWARQTSDFRPPQTGAARGWENGEELWTEKEEAELARQGVRRVGGNEDWRNGHYMAQPTRGNYIPPSQAMINRGIPGKGDSDEDELPFVDAHSEAQQFEEINLKEKVRPLSYLFNAPPPQTPKVKTWRSTFDRIVGVATVFGKNRKGPLLEPIAEQKAPAIRGPSPKLSLNIIPDPREIPAGFSPVVWPTSSFTPDRPDSSYTELPVPSLSRRASAAAVRIPVPTFLSEPAPVSTATRHPSYDQQHVALHRSLSDATSLASHGNLLPPSRDRAVKMARKLTLAAANDREHQQQLWEVSTSQSQIDEEEDNESDIDINDWRRSEVPTLPLEPAPYVLPISTRQLAPIPPPPIHHSPLPPPATGRQPDVSAPYLSRHSPAHGHHRNLAPSISGQSLAGESMYSDMTFSARGGGVRTQNSRDDLNGGSIIFNASISRQTRSRISGAPSSAYSQTTFGGIESEEEEEEVPEEKAGDRLKRVKEEMMFRTGELMQERRRRGEGGVAR